MRPDVTTYTNLFASWDGIEEIDPNQIDLIATGATITSGAIMARATGTSPVYLVTNGTKNGVASPSVMAYCNFRWPRTTYPPVLVDFIPTGITIDYGD